MSDSPKSFDDVIGMLTHDCHVYALEVARLKAEVERLRKAGDAVALDYAERIEIEAGETAKTLMKIVPVLREWNAAKEGKPSV